MDCQICIILFLGVVQEENSHELSEVERVHSLESVNVISKSKANAI